MLFMFDDFRLDSRRRELRRGAEACPIEPQVFDLLEFLIRNRERVVTKDDLIATVWNGRIVSDATLASRINSARTAIGDDGGTQRLIRTVHRKGVRFVGDVEEMPEGGVVEGPASAQRDKPSIAILPFQNMSGDPEQEYFADGIVEDITTALSRMRSLFVIARNSSFAFKGRAVDVKEVGHELGVRYVVEGSVRKAGDRVRITTQLVETETGNHVWADRYDRPLDDIFELQDEITLSVIGTIEPRVRQAEIERIKRKRPDRLDAYDLVLRALPLISASMMAEDAARAVPLLENALALQPDYAEAHAMLAWSHQILFRQERNTETNRNAAIRHARAAMAHGQDNVTALTMAAYVIAMVEHDRPVAFEAFERALSIGPSSAITLFFGSVAFAWAGEAERAIEWGERALRFSPFDFLNIFSFGAIAIGLFQKGEYERAAKYASRAIQSNPSFSLLHFLQVGPLFKLGRIDEAKASAARGLELQRSFSIARTIAALAIPPALSTKLEEAWRAVDLPA
jgi:TolB-like protein/Tfp pilus assembly protein PilF